MHKYLKYLEHFLSAYIRGVTDYILTNVNIYKSGQGKYKNSKSIW